MRSARHLPAARVRSPGAVADADCSARWTAPPRHRLQDTRLFGIVSQAFVCCDRSSGRLLRTSPSLRPLPSPRARHERRHVPPRHVYIYLTASSPAHTSIIPQSSLIPSAHITLTASSHVAASAPSSACTMSFHLCPKPRSPAPAAFLFEQKLDYSTAPISCPRRTLPTPPANVAHLPSSPYAHPLYMYGQRTRTLPTRHPCTQPAPPVPRIVQRQDSTTGEAGQTSSSAGAYACDGGLRAGVRWSQCRTEGCTAARAASDGSTQCAGAKKRRVPQ